MLGGLPLLSKEKKKKSSDLASEGTPNPSAGSPNSGSGSSGMGTPNPNSGVGTPNPNNNNNNNNNTQFLGIPNSNINNKEFITPDDFRPDLQPSSWLTPNNIDNTSAPTSTLDNKATELDSLIQANQALPSESPVRALTSSDVRIESSDVNYDTFNNKNKESDTGLNSNTTIPISTNNIDIKDDTIVSTYQMSDPQISRSFGGIVDLISDNTDEKTATVNVPGVGIRTVSSSSLTPIKTPKLSHKYNENDTLLTSWGEPISAGDTITVLTASSNSPETKYGSSEYTVLSSTPDGKNIIVANSDKAIKMISTDSISNVEPINNEKASEIAKIIQDNKDTISNLSYNTPEQRSVISVYSDNYPVSVNSDIPGLSIKTGSITLRIGSQLTPENVSALSNNSTVFIDNIPYRYLTKTKSFSPVFSSLSGTVQESDISSNTLSQMLQDGHKATLYTDSSHIRGTELGQSPTTQDLIDLPINSTLTLPTTISGGKTSSATKVGNDLWSVNYWDPVQADKTIANPNNKEDNKNTFIQTTPKNQSVYLSSDQLQNYLPSLHLESTPQFNMPNTVDKLDEVGVGLSFNLEDSPFFGVSGIATRTSATSWGIFTESGTVSIDHSDLQDYMSKLGNTSNQISFNTPIARYDEGMYFPGTQIIDPITGSVFSVTSDGKYLKEGTDVPVDRLPTLSAGAFKQNVSPDTITSQIATGQADSLPIGTFTSALTGDYQAVKVKPGSWEVYNSQMIGSHFNLTDNQLETLVNSGVPIALPYVTRSLSSNSKKYVLNQTVFTPQGTGVISSFNKDSDSAVILLENGKSVIIPLEDLNLGTPNIVDLALSGLAQGTPNPLPKPNPNPNPNPMPNPNPNPHGVSGGKGKDYTEDQKKHDSTLDYPIVSDFNSAQDISTKKQNKDSSLGTNLVLSDPELTSQYKAIKKTIQSRLKNLKPNQFLPSADRITAAQINELFSAEVLSHLNDPLPVSSPRGDLINSANKTIGALLVDTGIISPEEYANLDYLIKAKKKASFSKKRVGVGKGTPYRKRLRFHQKSYYDKVLHMDGNIFILKGTDSAIEPVRKDTYEVAGEYLKNVIDTQDFSEYVPELSQFLRAKTVPALADMSHLTKSDTTDTISTLDKKFVNNPTSFYSNTMTKATSFVLPDGSTVGSREELRTLVGSLISDYGYLEAYPGMDVVYNSDPQFNDIKLNIRTAGGTPVMYNGKNILLPRGTSLYIDFIDAGPDMDTVWVEIVPTGWLPPQVIEG